MTVPILRYIAHYDHYEVIVENLPDLSVSQIQQLEAYAESRRGKLDFTTFSFKIYKRIDFYHFNKTLEHSGIIANTIESEITKPSVQKDEPEAEDAVVGFGKHRGMKYSDLPNDYLLWLKKNYQGTERNFIVNECARRSI